MKREGLTINAFLTTKRRLADVGEIVSRTFAEYVARCEHLADKPGPSLLPIATRSNTTAISGNAA